MKFEDIPYKRIEFEEVAPVYREKLDVLKAAGTPEAFMAAFNDINKLRAHIMTMETLVNIRHTINTADEFYDKENEYWNETTPKLAEYEAELSQIVLTTPHRKEIEAYIPEPFFKAAEYQMKVFSPEIISDLQLENKLASEYGKLKASAKIEFDGEVLNLAQINKKAQSPDRDTRKRAEDAKYAFYASHIDEFDRIYDDLVHVRDRMAKTLGYENYIEMGYYRMNRFDYNQDMVANYRKQILEEITPLTMELCKRQANRLALDELKYYDYSYEFASGNATPKKDPEGLVQAAVDMYHKMSPETGEFIDLMNENHLWDLVSKPNKEMGGYCTCLLDYGYPFIFSNFNGTSGDVDVLTHEAGHAFMGFMARDIAVPDCIWPTMESCEIHSMSMEFMAYPWLENFFEEDTNKYKFSHVVGTLKFLPYGVTVDHFQHEVYANPDMTPVQRRETWRRLEKMYTPFKNFDGCDFLENGGWWYQQGHIFASPFYYIDYTLAQVCALQFFVRNLNHDENAWKDYLHLCSLGGTMTFTSLVKEAGLRVPFDDGCVHSVVETIKNYLDSIDDTKL